MKHRKGPLRGPFLFLCRDTILYTSKLETLKLKFEAYIMHKQLQETEAAET